MITEIRKKDKQTRDQKRAKNKEKRKLYITLADEISTSLCTFCKFFENDSYACCEGYSYCAHPVENISIIHEEALCPGDDCWAFRQSMPLDSIIEIVSGIIANNYDQWGFLIYSKTAFTIYGYIYDTETGTRKPAKLRIGHNGKPTDNTIVQQES